jgi:glutamyl/glutaminyl-tRNA synthetase
MVEEFSLHTISKNAPIFNRKKLEWFNSLYIRKTEEDRLTNELLPYLEKAGLDVQNIDLHYLTQVIGILKENLVVLSQIEEYLGIFFDEKFFFEEEAKTILSDPENHVMLQTVLHFLEALPEIIPDAMASLLSQIEEKTGRRGKNLYAPLRAGITGKIKGPELIKTIPLLGKERVVKRLKMAIEIS